MNKKAKTTIKVTLALFFMASVGMNVIQYLELKAVPPTHEYQMDIVGEHAISVYDGITKLGTISYDLDQENPTELDNLILLDNQ